MQFSSGCYFSKKKIVCKYCKEINIQIYGCEANKNIFIIHKYVSFGLYQINYDYEVIIKYMRQELQAFTFPITLTHPNVW